MVRDLTPAELEAVTLIDAMSGDDPEVDHCGADSIVLGVVHPAVAEAYNRLVGRAKWWVFA